MDLSKRDYSNVFIVLSSCGPLLTFTVDCCRKWFLRRRCCLTLESHWSSIPCEDEMHQSLAITESIKGPFIVIRDRQYRGSPTSMSSNGNGDSVSEYGDPSGPSRNGNNSSTNNHDGLAWIFSEFELAVEASPPYIIVDSYYADEISKNIHRGNLCRLFTVTGSIVSSTLAFWIQTLPVSVPVLSMTIATAGFYGMFYLKDASMKYGVVGRKWRANGFQLSPEHFINTDQPPLILKAANSRFRKTLRILPVFLPAISTGIVLWRFWKVLA